MINDYIKSVENLTDVVCDLRAVAQIKLKASTENRLATIEECMTKEQSLSLKLRGADKKRVDLQNELGFGSKTFVEILESSDKETQTKLLPTFERFSREMQIYQSIHEDAMCSISVNLRKINNQMDNSGDKIYKKNANGERPEIRFTERSI